ncbi:GntR family transcriptional regulator [Virgisporangium aurantiacum]|uniref:GntR family transcriptional regulator n=1 Tax=Virgisporangium aurantiacum TaxID=175570 RepID=UPI001951E0CB|nr:winged helix-turn-helix domain-containing protein [Virgisporangium aurantiacum]
MIDRTGPVAPYRQVSNEIAARIGAGDLAPRQRIPTETELCKEFGVSRGTARNATAALRDLGLVVTVPHRGTFVAQHGEQGAEPAD